LTYVTRPADSDLCLVLALELDLHLDINFDLLGLVFIFIWIRTRTPSRTLTWTRDPDLHDLDVTSPADRKQSESALMTAANATHRDHYVLSDTAMGTNHHATQRYMLSVELHQTK